MKPQDLAAMIDHTLLKPEATINDIQKLCDEAKVCKFATVCVNPWFVSACYDFLKDSKVGLCTVVGFPLGATTAEVKAFETAQAIQDGATEIDMVINIGALKAKNDDYVLADIEAVVHAAKHTKVKVILETCLLSDEEIVRGCQLSMKAGARFVKTSTGFSTSGASLEAVKLMKQTVGNTLEVKASGGIKDYLSATSMIAAGATRLGTSSGIKIIT